MRPTGRALVACLLVVSLAAGYGIDPAVGTGSERASVDTPGAVEIATDSSASQSEPSADAAACPSGARSSVTSGAFPAPDRANGPDRGGTEPTAAATTNDGEPRIVEVFPDTPRQNNAGEYLVVDLPGDTALGNLTVTDGHATARLPEVTRSGRIALTARPNATASFTDYPVVAFDGGLRLAADGDELRLRVDGQRVDAIRYERASENHVWYRTDDAIDASAGTFAGGSWWPRDATCLPVASVDPDSATAFVLPDSPEVPLDAIRDADERILLGGYTFTDRTVADALVAAVDRGVRVEVLIEGSPVGGTPSATRDVLDDLAAAGATVRVIGGEGDRYAYHHPKYAVTDDDVLVTTENWKPAGVGGAGSRGLGVRVRDADLADALATVFQADADGPDVESWTEYRRTATFVDDDEDRPAWAEDDAADDDPGRDTYPSAIDPSAVDVDAAELLLAPDNAEGRLLDLLRSAEESIRVTQPTIGDADLSLLDELVAAARRGVDVRILLDRSWYVEDENERLADRLDDLAADEDLSLSVRLAEAGDRFEKIHAKGIVIDEETAVVGSVNWNENSLRDNREVALVVHGEAAGAYFAGVFDRDWEGYEDTPGPYSLPIGLALVVIAALLVAGLAGTRYVDFERVGNGRDGTIGVTARGERHHSRSSASRRPTAIDGRESGSGVDGIVIQPNDETEARGRTATRDESAERRIDGPR